MKAKLLCAALAACLTLTACGTASLSGNTGTPPDASREEPAGAAPDESTVQGAPSQESEPAQGENAMRNAVLGKVPDGYCSDAATQQGTLENFAYGTRDYIGNGGAKQSNATVYLPYGYEQDDSSTRYDILYLQHGAYGNERTWMHEYGDSFKNMIDHMIEDDLIPPLIIVMPYLPSGNEWYHDTTPIFYSGELKNDLMPAVEASYRTYAESASDAGFEASRSHRAFGGFSAGGTTTWRVLLEGLDRFEYFMPLSGGLTLGGDGSAAAEDAAQIADAALASGYGKREYYVFAATGTRDVAYQGLTAQIESMKSLTNAFDYTRTGFADGNLMYYTVEGNRHDYQYTYEYVFNGLQCLFSKWANSPIGN